jgi:hypothetical protein
MGIALLINWAALIEISGVGDSDGQERPDECRLAGRSFRDLLRLDFF